MVFKMSENQKLYDISPENIKFNNGSHGLIFSKIKNYSNVLDVGCATGIIGEGLYNEKKCNVIGIDYSEKSLEIARQKNSYDRLFKINLDYFSDELNEYENYFDYIIMADVLEHLKIPGSILANFKKLLKPGGLFLISIPNIAHGSLKLKLLQNKFEYTEYGLLDNTHISFFTLENIIQLLNRLNFELITLNRVYLDIEETEQKIDLSKYPLCVKNYVSQNLESFVYQYVIETKISNTGDIKKINEKFLLPAREEKMRLKKYLTARRGSLRRRITRSIEKFVKKCYLSLKDNCNVK